MEERFDLSNCQVLFDQQNPSTDDLSAVQFFTTPMWNVDSNSYHQQQNVLQQARIQHLHRQIDEFLSRGTPQVGPTISEERTTEQQRLYASGWSNFRRGPAVASYPPYNFYNNPPNAIPLFEPVPPMPNNPSPRPQKERTVSSPDFPNIKLNSDYSSNDSDSISGRKRSGSSGSEGEERTGKKKRFVWTEELTTAFQQSMEHLGDEATAKSVMSFMRNKGVDISTLTRVRVANHVQYYKTRKNKMMLNSLLDQRQKESEIQ